MSKGSKLNRNKRTGAAKSRAAMQPNKTTSNKTRKLRKHAKLNPNCLQTKKLVEELNHAKS